MFIFKLLNKFVFYALKTSRVYFFSSMAKMEKCKNGEIKSPKLVVILRRQKGPWIPSFIFGSFNSLRRIACLLSLFSDIYKKKLFEIDFFDEGKTNFCKIFFFKGPRPDPLTFKLLESLPINVF